MARTPMTPEQKKAFGEKMRLAREKKKIPPVNPPTSVNPTFVTPPSAAGQVDPALVAKIAELDEAIRKVNETNKIIQEQEKIRSEAFESGKVITEAEKLTVIESHKSKSERMKEKLKLQPKVRVFMPLEGKEKPGTLFPVTLNGYRVNVPKGVYVEVPEQVGDIIMSSLNQTAEAENNPMRIDADTKKSDILA